MERLVITRAPGETLGDATRRAEALARLWTGPARDERAEAARRDALRRLARLEGRARPRAG